MGFFSNVKSKDEIILVFDIGSGKVGGALFETQESGVPKMIFSLTEPIAFSENLDAGGLTISMTSAMESIANKIFTSGKGVPKEIYCVLSSPWYVSETRTILYRKNTDFIFTEKLADGLVEKEVNLFKEQYMAQHGSSAGESRIIELKNIKAILNGYETDKPLNQRANDLQMNIFISMGEESILQSIENTIRKYFHFDRIKFSSFVLSSFAVVRDLYSEQNDFLLVDIGGEITDITMAKKNVLRESISFPMGRNFLTRGVALDMQCSLNEAESMISMFLSGHAEASTAQKISASLDKNRLLWLKNFQESLSNISSDISIPSSIYLSVDKDLSDLFSQTIKAEQFNQYMVTESKFEIVLLDSPIFHNLALFSDAMFREPNLIIDSVYINRLLINSASADIK